MGTQIISVVFLSCLKLYPSAYNQYQAFFTGHSISENLAWSQVRGGGVFSNNPFMTFCTGYAEE